MAAYSDLKPGAQPVAFTKKLESAAISTLIWRVPWGNPVNKVFEPRKIIFACNSQSGGALTIWDQDLSSATPTSNGSAGHALITVAPQPYGLAASSGGSTSVVATLDLNNCPHITFLAGLTGRSTTIDTVVTVEGQIY